MRRSGLLWMALFTTALVGGVRAGDAAGGAPAAAFEDDDDHDVDGGAGTTGRGGAGADFAEEAAVENLAPAAAPAVPRGASGAPRSVRRRSAPTPAPAPAPVLEAKAQSAASVAPGAGAPGDGSVRYGRHGRRHTGYLAAARGGVAGRPAVVVIHPAAGLDDLVRLAADRLAGAGFSALAVDLYGGPPPAGRRAAEVAAVGLRGRRGEVLQNLADASEYLVRAGAVRVGVLGWGIGGGYAFDLALSRPERVDVVVAYGGEPGGARETWAALEAPFLLHIGGDNPAAVDRADVLRAAVRKKRIQSMLVEHPGRTWAFADARRKREYKRLSASQAWQKSLLWLKKFLTVEE